uniref:Uncharacterized protein n=1 Tax=Arundo donax TaxID=35708 RepID=A0A0A9GPT9_ARUDO
MLSNLEQPIMMRNLSSVSWPRFGRCSKNLQSVRTRRWRFERLGSQLGQSFP